MSAHEIDLTERKSISLPIESLNNLIEWWWGGGSSEPQMSPPLVLGWDIHRQWPSEGFAVWRDLMHQYEPPFLAAELLGPSDLRQAVTNEQYEAALIEQWARYDRPKHWTDDLIVDVMHDERARGYEPGGEGWESTEATLNDLATKCGAKRAAVKAEEDARIERHNVLVRRYFDLDDAGYAKWKADGRPDGDGIKFERWYDRNFRERLEIIKAASAAAKGTPMPPNMSIVPAAPLPDLLKTSGEFVQAFEPPEYLVDGILQRRYFYSVTAQTGVGKTAIAMRLAAHVATGRPLGDIAVEQGVVLYFAGENPSDVQARWLGLTRDMGIVPNTATVHFLPGAMDLTLVAERISVETARKGIRPALVVVDTAAAYNFNSEDENSNTQAGNYARQLRSLTMLPGGPAVLVLCHPTKRAGDDDLIPRGGGAFLAEVDGNIAVQKRNSLLVATAQGKFRGSQAWELRFELETMRDHPTLRDTRGRLHSHRNRKAGRRRQSRSLGKAQ